MCHMETPVDLGLAFPSGNMDRPGVVSRSHRRDRRFSAMEFEQRGEKDVVHGRCSSFLININHMLGEKPELKSGFHTVGRNWIVIQDADVVSRVHLFHNYPHSFHLAFGLA